MRKEEVIEHVKNFTQRGYKVVSNVDDATILMARVDKKYKQVGLAEISLGEVSPIYMLLDKEELEGVLDLFN